MGSGESSPRTGLSGYENLLWKRILAVGTASGKVLEQEGIRRIGEKARRPVWLEHDEQQGAQWSEIRLEI